ncbi:hypothetical protein [Mesobacillus campisalis]|nr:hypothetical protein [Mesobacillus campisalis]
MNSGGNVTNAFRKIVHFMTKRLGTIVLPFNRTLILKELFDRRQ